MALAAAQERGRHEATVKQGHQRPVAQRRALSSGRWMVVSRYVMEAGVVGLELCKLCKRTSGSWGFSRQKESEDG
jgi:hypothetical protein